MSDPDSLPNIALVVALIVGVFAILAGVDKALGWGAKPPGAVPVIAPPAVGPACPSCGRADPACSAYCSRCGGVLGGECASCGTERPPGGRFCRTCGEAFQGTAVSGVVGLAAPVPEFRPAAPAPALAATPSRSWFLHGLLVVVTLGCWFPVWFGLAWGDAKRAAGVAGMPGFQHGLLSLVPLVNLWRVAVHFRTIRGARLARGMPPGMGGWEAVLWVVVLVLGTGGTWYYAFDAGYLPGLTTREAATVLRLVPVLVLAWLAAVGQRSLNRVA